MLSFSISCANGEVITLDNALSARLCRDEAVPADSLEAVLAYTKFESAPVGIELLADDITVYCGVIDEVITRISDMPYLRLCSRSMAAVLLDNEAYPLSYKDPSAGVIFDRNIRPYGIISYIGEDTTAFGELRVTKGMSCWQVLEKYCVARGSFPRVDGYSVCLDGVQSDRVLEFSACGSGMIYSDIEYADKRCSRISRIFVRCGDGFGYDTVISDDEAIRQGICRERYLDAAQPSAGGIALADEALRRARSGSFVATLRCPYAITDVLGAEVRITDSSVSTGRLYVSALTFTQSSSGTSTELILRKKES